MRLILLLHLLEATTKHWTSRPTFDSITACARRRGKVVPVLARKSFHLFLSASRKGSQRYAVMGALVHSAARSTRVMEVYPPGVAV